MTPHYALTLYNVILRTLYDATLYTLTLCDVILRTYIV